ncbi:MAG: single-stranded-DNA-specific exonuclease RecJ [Halobacteriovoraceae bacterium]|nr:single-stranded-DNA-specific exonuclease RecJ [Halobacteriovoraceae bacterium]
MEVSNVVIERIFQNRNIGQESIEEMLSWDLNDLPDMFSLNDLDKAAQRIVDAIDGKEKIGIYGDYDVDGTTSCAFFYHFFKTLDIKVEMMQPNRLREGYGLHCSSIDEAASRGIDILITVDCGITNVEAASYAREKGIDLVVTDHHRDVAEEMPRAFAVINPNRRDEPEDSPLRSLAGVGVAFVLGWRIRLLLLSQKRKCPSLYPLLPFVAVGTVCDMVPLSSMNLKLVRHGLKELAEYKYPGLSVFFNKEERLRGIIPGEKLSFKIGPLINAKGRLDHPERALRLLISEDGQDAYEHFSHLEVCNNQRKSIQAQVFKEAKEQVLQEESEPRIACLPFAPHWHEGVVGIVAAKLVEEFGIPAVVFTEGAKQKGMLKASARTAGEMDLFCELEKCSHLFSKFGGHKAAAGFSMPKENLSEFRGLFIKNLALLSADMRTASLKWDCEIFHREITPDLARSLEYLGPFGVGNPRPVFFMRKMKLNAYDILKDVHVRWNFANPQYPELSLRGISFNYLGQWGKTSPREIHSVCRQGKFLEAVFTLEINRFNGNEYIQLNIIRVDEEGTLSPILQ